MDSRAIIKRLRREGWLEASVTGSHHVYKKPGIASLISVTHPRKDVSPGLLRGIQKIAGWKD